MPNEELTHRQRERILRNVILGAPAPHDESPDAQAWRHECERDVAKIKAQGGMPESPFDPTYGADDAHGLEMGTDAPGADDSFLTDDQVLPT